MIEFILNNQLIKTNESKGGCLLDFIRHSKNLSATKVGCREGDCGACTVLIGNIENDKLVYKNMTSCLMSLINTHGKHVVTLEGINQEKLTPVQTAMIENNATQCGFCTPGFVMSLTGYSLTEAEKNNIEALKSIDGNICRCTGYKSIEKAAFDINILLLKKPKTNSINWLIEQKYIPSYFAEIEEKLKAIKPLETLINIDTLKLGGGTDLNVQKHHEVKKSAVVNLFDDSKLKQIIVVDNEIQIGASVTVSTFSESSIIKEIFPTLNKFIKLVSSTPIRNMATLAGNLVNASPIGDMSVFFLALNADISFNTGRRIALKDFYKSYKVIDKTKDEIITHIYIKKPHEDSLFNFEKVCKRTHLDIATVNTAFFIQVENNIIKHIALSAGGVAPFPLYLKVTSKFFLGKELTIENLQKGIEIMNQEIAPISDVRGTKEYKRLLLKQLVVIHFSLIKEELVSILIDENIQN